MADADGSSTTPAPPVVAAAAASAKSKKRAAAVRPVPPPSVCTALLILRGALAGVVGCPVGSTGGAGAGAGGGGGGTKKKDEDDDGDDATASLMQPSYIKDGYPSGKFSVGLGKRTGTLCGLELPEASEDGDACEGVLDAIEAAANRIRVADVPIATFELTKEEAVAKYGECFLDAGQKQANKKKKKKKKKDEEEEEGGPKEGPKLTIAYIEGVALACPPGPVYASTGMIPGAIVLERGNMASGVTSGKKARKAEIVLKFKVDEEKGGIGKDPAEATTGEPVAAEAIAALLTSEIRMEEGTELQRKATEAEEARRKAADAAKEKKAAEEADAKAKEEEMVVTAFEVTGKIDYNRLVDDFGSKLIEPDLLKRLEALTVGRGTVPFLHRFLRRDIFFSHRDLAKICDCLEQNKPMYLYTGRGPSSGAMHLGHLVPFLFTQWLQKAFRCPLVIQMTDDEKFLFKGEYDPETGDNLDYFAGLTMENARDIIACGFDKDKTFLFSDLDYVGTMYPNIVRIWKAVTTNTVNGIFGFDGFSNIGKIAFPAIQAAPSFPSSFPKVLNAGRDSNAACLIPCAIDQDPYFRMTRDVAHKLVTKSHPLGGKPALIHSKFFPPLQGAEGKMSSSDPNSAVFLTDGPEEIERKIKEYAFSGGRETKAEQMELGANLDVDVAYQWLRFFLEDDEELKTIGEQYGSGKGEYWSTGAVKKRLVAVLQELVADHQKRREEILDEVVREWMEERCIL